MKKDRGIANTRISVRQLLAIGFALAVVFLLASPLPQGLTSLSSPVANQTNSGAVALPGNPSFKSVPAGTQGVVNSTSQVGVKVGRSIKNDVSPRLRDMGPGVPPKSSSTDADRENPGGSTGAPAQHKGFKDPVLQTSFGGGQNSPLTLPTPILDFAGISNADNGSSSATPPDTNGAAGFNNYVQVVNHVFAVYDKSGNRVYGPAWDNSIWQGFGGACESHNDGDPTVLYDKQIARWVFSQFAVGSPPDYTPSYECVAVSTTDDPTGSWYRYSYLLSNDTLYDYPQLGVWPSGYFLSATKISGGLPQNMAAIAFDRVRMASGQPATYQEFQAFITNPSVYGMLPADDDGYNLPPTGSPEYFLQLIDTSHVGIYKFNVDWQNPANSSFTGPARVAVAQFSTFFCGNSLNGCIGQPGTSTRLAPLYDRPMHRLAYRNFGDHESLVVNHTVDVGNESAPVAAVRWYEIRDPGAASPTLYQQGSYNPGVPNNRWMGSIAQDHDGNIALGMSLASVNVYPSIVYAGRLASDPLGVLAQGENAFVLGTGSQTDSSRWGDYSSMTVDPFDDCTFWYTTEYYQNTGTNWQTRIGTFKFPGCGVPHTATPTVTGTPTNTPTGTPPAATSTPQICNVQVSGSITNSDPSHANYINLNGIASTCGSSKACPGVTTDSSQYHYDTYTYNNPSSSPICITVTVDPSQCGAGSEGIEAFAFLNSFNPNFLCATYLADYGREFLHSPGSFSFTVPAGATFVVEVEEFLGGNGCGNYTLTVSGLVCPTPTVTVTPAITNTPTVTRTPTFTPTLTATATATASPTPQNTLNGHLTWQGITQPNTRNVGITATLTLCVNGAPAGYAVTTDQSGNFSLPLSLGNGSYNWRITGSRWLANAGTLALTGGSNSSEFGTLRAGDANNNNVVNTQDFAILKTAFGTSLDPRADFDNNGVVNLLDFNLLKANFGQGGGTLSCP